MEKYTNSIYNYYSEFIYKLYECDCELLNLEGDVVERGVVPHLQQCIHVALFRQLDGHLVSILIRRVVYLLDDGVSQQCVCEVVGVGQFGCDGLSRILGEAGVGE